MAGLRDVLLEHMSAARMVETKVEELAGMGESSRPGSDRDFDSDLDAEESLDLNQMASISTAGQRFHWLCQALGVHR